MRDYSFEHKVRKANNKRFLAEIDRIKATEFMDRLKKKNITYVTWLNIQIDNELKGKN